jgi:hypothetical protein
MKKSSISLTTLILAMGIAIPASLQAKEYHVYFLGGQSNMDGHGQTQELATEFREPVQCVMFFHGAQAADGGEVGGTGAWKTLQPNPNRFGPELFFGRRMRELYPARNIAIIKYARSGTSIDADAAESSVGCWQIEYNRGNGINQYDHALATINHALRVKDIDGDGVEDQLIPAGIAWMQGETDACRTEEIARRYKQHLKDLMSQLRQDLGEKKLPVVVGRISNSADAKAKGFKTADQLCTWKHGEIVREQQAAYCREDGKASLVTTTDNYGYCDPWHYDTAGQKDLGVQFANQMKKHHDAD